MGCELAVACRAECVRRLKAQHIHVFAVHVKQTAKIAS